MVISLLRHGSSTQSTEQYTEQTRILHCLYTCMSPCVRINDDDDDDECKTSSSACSVRSSCSREKYFLSIFIIVVTSVSFTNLSCFVMSLSSILSRSFLSAAAFITLSWHWRRHSDRIIWDLRIYIDSDISMGSHVTKTVCTCFAILRQLWSVRQSIPRSVLQSLVTSLVLTRLDYGNTTVAGIPLYLLKRLQSVMNTAAPLVFSSSWYEHITPHFYANCTGWRQGSELTSSSLSLSTSVSGKQRLTVSLHCLFSFFSFVVTVDAEAGMTIDSQCWGLIHVWPSAR